MTSSCPWLPVGGYLLGLQQPPSYGSHCTLVEALLRAGFRLDGVPLALGLGWPFLLGQHPGWPPLMVAVPDDTGYGGCRSPSALPAPLAWLASWPTPP